MTECLSLTFSFLTWSSLLYWMG